ncbi:E3 ubiquitin-protein ligase TRIM47-like isoform X2 [Sardina pilchardus]|uniref:E3 ubiquitin-protein ligase TRIM47-like isoform X2 n=1 Tax=Sardina pilchardus TaxID=27697 RepID=UPI002E12CFDE
MAEANRLISVDENHFQCSICLELLKEPVTIPCGHSYCMECITMGWDREAGNDVGCPQCRQTFNPRPVLVRNLILASMVAELQRQDAQLDGGFAEPGDVECTVCIGRKRKADRTCLDCLDTYCSSHFCRHEELFLGKKHKMVEAVAKVQTRVCTQHNKPLEVFCRTDATCVCVACIINEHKGHDVVSPADAQERRQRAMESILQSAISRREAELNKLTENVEPLKSSAQAAVEHSANVFSELHSFIEEKHEEVVKMIRDKEEAEQSRAEQLQKEIKVLKKRADDMAQLASKEDHVHFLQSLSSFSPKDLPAVTVSDRFSFDGVKTSVSQLKDAVNQTCVAQFGLVWRSVKFAMFEEMTRNQLLKHFRHPKFDQSTAYRQLFLSEGCTKVEWGYQTTNNCNGFTDCQQVLCSELLSNCAYWEVQWNFPNPSDGISIAVASHDIERKGENCRFGLNNKSWCLDCKTSGLTYSHNNFKTEIPGPVPTRIGVYLDRKAGILSFYRIIQRDADLIADLIYRVQPKFSKSLRPGFYLSLNCSIKLF